VEYVQSFEASFTTMFVVRYMKDCMTILLLLDELYDEWGDIFLMREQGKILDGFKKLPLKPQPIKKSTFNCLVGLKESHIQKLVNGLKCTKSPCTIILQVEETHIYSQW
jgi:hypothetical protein